ncbi:hypothetical protein [Leptospira licerasiae]|uniref:Lipoprotein n=1 Tax=Leptospira licerasiae str. MMD4847 TaxID=1049971 RepID=A0ABP2R8S5_9LEPT|nr:hypothetical protein [Leptospira licerasiae]EIE00823.1 hypothetical protein LEP1GSC185_0466 [Leptospira licerasiae serovar Varillal str. VAR 010]EJZ40759.1 putative lipoprotein [Leptospira licerasiae str. MMD4847]
MKVILLFLILFAVSCKTTLERKYLPESSWDKKEGRAERSNGERVAYDVRVWEVKGEILKNILEDPNNNTTISKSKESLLEPNLGWDPKGKRVFLVDIRPNTIYRPVDTLGEIGIRLGECEGKDKVEFPYTYYFFPVEEGGGRDGKNQITKHKFENSKSSSSPTKLKHRNSYEEETKKVLAAFSESCFQKGPNSLEVQVLGLELYTFRFLFEY